MTQREIKIALVGNPNSGKTTVFNNLTGARQHVGNWPGVTVEQKSGRLDYGGFQIEVVDLPGVYSLTAYAPDELIARNFILEERPDFVVNIVDASNLERNLYLSLQLLELEMPLVMALNMMDEAARLLYRIDIPCLSRRLDVPVVQMIAKRNRGTAELLREIIAMAAGKAGPSTFKTAYRSDVSAEIDHLTELISTAPAAQLYPPRWLAIKLLEGDADVLGKFQCANLG